MELKRKMAENNEQKSNIEDQQLNYNSLIKNISDLCIMGMKNTAKTTLLMWLARELRKDAHNHVIIFETFPKWMHEFDKIPYMTIAETDIQEKENLPYLEQDKSIIQWSKDFEIVNGSTVNEFLKTNKDCLFLIEALDMEKISAFMTYVIYQIYRKQYLRAKAGRLETVNENYYFLCEESHNLLDSTVIAKKTFNKLRKIQNEFRNLKMHLICVALRLQDLSPKIRSKMSILLSRVSLDDYQLKVRMLLRNSEFRDIITELPKGTFIFPELNLKLTTEPFKQEGTPYLWHKTEQPQPQQPQGLMQRFKNWKNKYNKALNESRQRQLRRHPQQTDDDDDEQESRENAQEDSEGDGLMSEGDIMFPADPEEEEE